MNIRRQKEHYPKNYRLRRKDEFESFYKLASNKSFGSIKIYYLKPSLTQNSRLGIAISSKTFNAVKRNSLKRLIREYFRKNQKQFLKIDLVVVVRYSKMENDDWKKFIQKVNADLNRAMHALNI